MSIKDELEKIKQLEKQIKKCESNILKEIGVNDKKAWLSRQHMCHKLDFKENPLLQLDRITLIEKEGYKLFTLKNGNVDLWFITDNKK